WTLPVDGGTMKRLAAGPGFAFEPCWSPDGQRVAFIRGKGWSGGQVKVIDSQTGSPVLLSVAVFATGKLAFTQDGSHLVGNLRGERQIEAFRTLDLKSGELKTLLRLPSMRQPWAMSQDG